ncbi:MAG: hypothetical protein HXS54_11520 [Theionarchaea archaeon]|nr:hypothetical protein [Theionarchaea archaeon]
MVHPYLLNDREKELLNALGRYPSLSMKELLTLTHYKRTSSLLRKIKRFKEENILWGPSHRTDYGKLCKNPLHMLFCIVELAESHDTVVSYLSLVSILVWIYPVLSHKELLCVFYISSNDQEVIALFQLLKDNNIIRDFSVHVYQQQIVSELPNFFGDPLPSLDNLLAPCEFPDTPFGQYDTEWNECDIAVLSYLRGYQGLKLVEILKNERKLKDRPWTYSQVKYSYQKMSKNKLIKKMYFIHPFPLDQCSDFFLFVRTDARELTQRILYNFARGGRIYREYALCEDWGLIGCICHPQFMIDLMHRLDEIDEIKEKTLYHLRSFPPGIQYVGQHSEFNFYDIEKQTLKYPYHVFREKIKEKLENK